MLCNINSNFSKVVIWSVGLNFLFAQSLHWSSFCSQECLCRRRQDRSLSGCSWRTPPRMPFHPRRPADHQSLPGGTYTICSECFNSESQCVSSLLMFAWMFACPCYVTKMYVLRPAQFFPQSSNSSSQHTRYHRRVLHWLPWEHQTQVYCTLLLPSRRRDMILAESRHLCLRERWLSHFCWTSPWSSTWGQKDTRYNCNLYRIQVLIV